MSNAVAGAALAGAAADAALVALAMVFFYTAGMVLNDVADAEIDRRERPERPIPSGAISPAAAIGVFVALVCGGLVLLAGEGLAPLLARSRARRPDRAVRPLAQGQPGSPRC